MLFDPKPDGDIGLACNSRHVASIENVYENTRAMYRAGVPLVVGSDAAGQGRRPGRRLGSGCTWRFIRWCMRSGCGPRRHSGARPL